MVGCLGGGSSDEMFGGDDGMVTCLPREELEV